jgi:hypothetical protein
MQWIRTIRVTTPATRGPDVEAVKRATFRALGAKHAWHEYASAILLSKRTYGRIFSGHIKRYQKQAGLPATGVFDRPTFDKLTKAKRKGTKEPAFDARARELWEQAEKRYLGDNQMRLKIVQAAARLYNRSGEIDYSQRRPWLYRPAPLVPSEIDCSGYVSHAYREAGVKDDPNGYEPDWPGYGFTGTLWATGKPISVAQLKPGDLLFYGRPWQAGSAAHVTVYRGGGRCYSMGSDSGPSDVAWNYRPVVGCRTYPLT